MTGRTFPARWGSALPAAALHTGALLLLLLLATCVERPLEPVPPEPAAVVVSITLGVGVGAGDWEAMYDRAEQLRVRIARETSRGCARMQPT